jgi:hypothetical protein
MKKIIAFYGLLFLHFHCAQAQQTAIKGNVLNDSTDQPVAFAQVQVKGGAGFITDAKGAFTITTVTQPVLIMVTAMGFDTAQVIQSNL